MASIAHIAKMLRARPLTSKSDNGLARLKQSGTLIVCGNCNEVRCSEGGGEVR